MTSDEINTINHNYEIAVRNLNSYAWNVMLPSEKLHDLQAIENKNAMDQNRLPCEVRAEPMQQNEWGYQIDNQIVVNSNELDNPNFMEHIDTVYHEGSHARDEQAQYFSEVRNQYTQEQLEERNAPVPDPEIDPNGYWNHPAEIAAREAGKEGVAQTMSNREHIIDVDRQISGTHSVNQIVQTYDYNALDIPISSETQSMDNSFSAGSTTQGNDVSSDATFGMDDGVSTSADISEGIEDGLDEGECF